MKHCLNIRFLFEIDYRNHINYSSAYNMYLFTLNNLNDTPEFNFTEMISLFFALSSLNPKQEWQMFIN